MVTVHRHQFDMHTCKTSELRPNEGFASTTYLLPNIIVTRSAPGAARYKPIPTSAAPKQSSIRQGGPPPKGSDDEDSDFDE